MVTYCELHEGGRSLGWVVSARYPDLVGRTAGTVLLRREPPAELLQASPGEPLRRCAAPGPAFPRRTHSPHWFGPTPEQLRLRRAG